MPTTFEIPLAGPKRERVDYARTIMSHGVADLPPAHIDEEARTYTTTLALPSGQPRTILIREGRRGFVRVEVKGRKPGAGTTRELTQAVHQILNLDEDLSEFYSLVASDPELSWVAGGAGRMLRTPTVYEAVVKTVCTTNVAWSATVRMATALVENLGKQATETGARAFPTAEAMATEPEAFYRDVVRAGYRSPYLRITTPRSPRNRPVRRGALDDAARAALAPDPRLLDPAEVRAPERPQSRRQYDRTPLSPLRALRRAGVLAVPDARLGRGAAAVRMFSGIRSREDHIQEARQHDRVVEARPAHLGGRVGDARAMDHPHPRGDARRLDHRRALVALFH